MTLSVKAVFVPAPSTRTSSKTGWSEIMIQFADSEQAGFPVVKMRVPVSFELTDTFQSTREAAMERAKVLSEAVVEALRTLDLTKLPGETPSDEW
jgi:hypothetical protein